MREAVKRFVKMMEAQLDENVHKGGWKDRHINFLLDELYTNFDQIVPYGLEFKGRRELENDIRRVVNIANFAMMCADNMMDVQKGLSLPLGFGKTQEPDPRNGRVRGFEIVDGCLDLAYLPQRQTARSAGYDIHAYLPESIVIEPGCRAIIGTGVTAYMQEDEELQIRPRSGLAFKHSVHLANFGTIDADFYPHEIKALLKNEGSSPFTVFPGMRIAQGVFAKFLKADDDRPASDERTGGLGHTGLM
jgi:dUTP pyrophosphatase